MLLQARVHPLKQEHAQPRQLKAYVCAYINVCTYLDRALRPCETATEVCWPFAQAGHLAFFPPHQLPPNANHLLPLFRPHTRVLGSLLIFPLKHFPPHMNLRSNPKHYLFAAPRPFLVGGCKVRCMAIAWFRGCVMRTHTYILSGTYKYAYTHGRIHLHTQTRTHI